MSYLILVRHGESRWNRINKFTGWVDVPLSENGLHEAMLLAKSIKNLRLNSAFTSHLERAHETLLITLSAQHCIGIFTHEHEHEKFRYTSKMDKNEIPIYTSWLLNERHYGRLQGMDKHQAAKLYGYEKVKTWRRSYTARPPGGESLRDVYDRVIPYFRKNIIPEINNNKNVLIVAHGNTLRAIMKYLDNISDEKIAQLELAPAKPLVYKYSRGKFKKTFMDYSFNRPIDWK